MILTIADLRDAKAGGIAGTFLRGIQYPYADAKGSFTGRRNANKAAFLVRKDLRRSVQQYRESVGKARQPAYAAHILLIRIYPSVRDSEIYRYRFTRPFGTFATQGKVYKGGMLVKFHARAEKALLDPVAPRKFHLHDAALIHCLVQKFPYHRMQGATFTGVYQKIAA